MKRNKASNKATRVARYTRQIASAVREPLAFGTDSFSPFMTTGSVDQNIALTYRNSSQLLGSIKIFRAHWIFGIDKRDAPCCCDIQKNTSRDDTV